MTKTMSTSFLSLPPELMVMVASHLDVSSYIALASSSVAILDILVSPLQWKALLQKTNLEQRKTTMNFKEYNEFTKDLDASNDIPKEVRVAINLKKKSMEEEVKGLAVFLKFVKHSKGLLLLDLLRVIGLIVDQGLVSAGVQIRSDLAQTGESPDHLLRRSSR